MRNLAFYLFIFLSSFVFVFGADCNVNGKELKKGEHYTPPGECIQMTCEASGQLSAIGCAEVQSLKPCKFTPTDLSKPYPECCPRFDC